MTEEPRGWEALRSGAIRAVAAVLDDAERIGDLAEAAADAVLRVVADETVSRVSEVERVTSVRPPGAWKPLALKVTADRRCGHCGRDNATAFAYPTPLCHPDDPALPDCYRRVTVYSEPVGALRMLDPLPAGVEGIVR